MANNEVIGQGKCVVCKENIVDVKINKNHKVYYFCDCGANVRLGSNKSRQVIAKLSAGETVDEMKPLNFKEKKENEQTNRESRRDTTGQRGETSRTNTGEDEDDFIF